MAEPIAVQYVSTTMTFRTIRYAGAAALSLVVVLAAHLDVRAQSDQPTCKPVSQRTGELGCWIVADEAVGTLPEQPVFWYLDTYASRGEAETAKGPRATVVEALGKIWLLTIEKAEWRAQSGAHVATIGPLPVRSDGRYSAMYMEAIFTAGMTSSIHTHSGPEAWYTASGETCLETPSGTMIGRAGGAPVIVPEGPPMHLTATGTVQRRAIVLILHDASRPATTVTHAWTPKGLCKTPSR